MEMSFWTGSAWHLGIGDEDSILDQICDKHIVSNFHYEDFNFYYCIRKFYNFLVELGVLLNFRYDRVYVKGSDFWPKSQILKEIFLNK